jgi:hypothetical protein
MARRKSKRGSWRGTLLIFLLTPLTVWLIALLGWFFWYDIVRLVTPPEQEVRSAAGRDNGRGSGRRERLRENIPDADRKELNDVLRER